MRFVQIGFGILIVGGLTALGCGDDGTASAPPATGGTGGKGGSAGAATGGTSGTGGSTAGKGGSAGAATGGTGGATGGSAGAATGGGAGMATGGGAGMATGGGAGMATGGSAGTPGGGGEGGGTTGDMCPPTAPMDGDSCDSDVNPGGNDPCTYGTTEVTTCSCPGFGMDPTWNCQTLSCPTAEPMSGDMCDGDMNPGGGDDPCVYGMNECTCAGGGGGGDPEWECTAPAMCPTAAPTDGDMCDNATDPGPMDGGCTFGMTTCVCGGMGGGGMDPTWNCGTCPDMEPDDGDDCDSDVNAFCAFAGGNCTCGAMNNEWNCF